MYGELWAGRRPSLHEMSDSLGLTCRHIDDLPTALAATGKTRVLRGVDAAVDALVPADAGRDRELATLLAELRLVKDDWEVGQLQEACDATALGFTDAVSEWDRVLEHGERWVEGTFFRRARAMGNDIGYDSIVGGGSHATTLHWIDNTGPVTPGTMLLLDMGVEATSLYTADVTRTLPVDGTYTPLQRDLYSLVLTAQQAGIEAVRPGAAYLDPHDAAMRVLAHGLEDLGLLPVSAEEALAPDSLVYKRWTLHSTSHMLGLDVHDCAGSRPEAYTARHPRRGHGAHRRAGAVLPGGRPPGPGGDARHRHPHRGRHPRHRRRLPEPLGLPAPRARRRRGVDGGPAWLMRRVRRARPSPGSASSSRRPAPGRSRARPGSRWTPGASTSATPGTT